MCFCDVCGEGMTKDLMMDHLQDHRFNRNIKCKQCNVICKLPYDLFQHMKTHNPQIECYVCNSWFSDKHALILHHRQHSGKFTWQNLTSSSLLTVNFLGTRPFDCKYCEDVSFGNEGSLKFHMQRHDSM